MTNLKNTMFSATEQIEHISKQNTSVYADKKELHKNRYENIINLINKFDRYAVDRKHIYNSILVPWKMNELI